jgi:hypothetical protein
MTLHYTWGSVTTLHDFEGGLGQPLDAFFRLPQFHGHGSWIICEVAQRAKSQESWPWNCVSPKEAFRSHPKTLPKSCSVKSYVHGPSTKCYSNEFLFMWGPHTWYNIIDQWLYDFRVPCPSVQVVVFEINPSDHEHITHLMPSGIHVNSAYVLHSLTPLVPQA